MKGSPLARAVITAIALLALLLPLRSLTSHQSAPPAPPPANASNANRNLHLELTSTTVPFKFQVSNGGKPLWTGESDFTTVSTDRQLKFPPEGIDLVLDVSWAGEKETAVRLALTPENSDTMVKTVWGTKNASEVLTFAGEK
jgi:hypothetical protein